MSEETKPSRQEQRPGGMSEAKAPASLARRSRLPGRRSPVSSQKLAPAAAGTVTMQARVDVSFASELLEIDAPVLGLAGPSAVVREGLRLVHKRARELAVAAEYDNFYSGQPAPLPDGVIPADAG